MLSKSASYINAIKNPLRRFNSYVIINGVTYEEGIIDWKFEDRVSDGDTFRIGQTISNSFTITIQGISSVFDGAEVKPYIGVEVSPSFFEYVTLGTFYVDDIQTNYDIVTLQCFDSMMKFNKPYTPTIGFPNTFQNIISDVCNQAGVAFSGTAPALTVSTVPVGYTCRDIIGFIAAIDAGNATINRSNLLVIRKFINPLTDIDLAVDGEQYFEGGLNRQTGVYTIGSVKGVRLENPAVSFSNGNTIVGTRELVFENLWINQAIVDRVGTLLNGLSFVPFTMNWQGNPALESGDNIQIDEYKVDIFKTVVLEMSLEYTGGLTSTLRTSLEGSIRNNTETASGATPTRYMWVKYAYDEFGNGMSDDSTGKLYMGVAYNKASPIEGTDPTEYNWTLIKGEEGVSTYTWVKYADSPTSGMSDIPTGKKYLGIAHNKATAEESTTYADYNWSLIEGPVGPQGPQGPKGDQGVEGLPGPPGDTLYTWKMYADDEFGANITDIPTGKRFLGLAVNKTTSIASTNPLDYTWSPLFDNIQVGGVNLVMNTSVPQTKAIEGWIATNWFLSDRMVSGEHTISFKYTCSVPNLIGIGLGTNGEGGIYALTPTLDSGTEYFVGTALFNRTTENTLAIYTNETITIWDVQLEAGNIATGWSISPEEEEARLGDIETSITANEEEIALKVSKGNLISEINASLEGIKIIAPKVDLQGYATFTALGQPGATIINGSNITTGAISADRIEGGTLQGVILYVDTTATVGTTLYIGQDWQNDQIKRIRFNGNLGSAGIQFIPANDEINIFAINTVRLNASYIELEATQAIDFNNANILNFKGTAVWG